MTYTVESSKVRYLGKPVRGADGATLQVLEGTTTWARDARQVYYAGLKVPKAEPGSFVAHSDDVGSDERRIFYRLAKREKPTSAKKPGDLARDLEVLQGGGLLVLRSGDVAYSAAPNGLRALSSVDADTFVLLGHGYAKDDAQVYWFDLGGEPIPVPGADLPSFTSLGGIARDKDGRYLNGQRDRIPLPIEEEQSAPLAHARLATETITDLLPRYFTLFDRLLPNDSSAQLAVPGPTTAVPEVTIALEGSIVAVTVGAQVHRGKLSALGLLATSIYGAARFTAMGAPPCLRIVPRAYRWPTDRAEEPPLWHRQLDLAYLLEALGHTSESRLLLDQVLRDQRASIRTGDLASDPRLRAEKLLPSALHDLPDPVTAQGTTTPAAVKWIVTESLQTDADPVIRRSVGDELLEIVRETSSEPARLAAASAPLLCLLDDEEPAVRYRAAVAFDLLASKLSYHRAYEAALSLSLVLSERGFNLDLQRARQWECLAALGRDDEAEAAWKCALGFDTGARAPRLHSGLHSDYPSLEVWRAFAELRLAEAHAWAAKGEHPSKELRRKKKALHGLVEDAEDLASRGEKRISSAIATMESLAEEAPAAPLQRSLAEFTQALSAISTVPPSLAQFHAAGGGTR